VDETSLRADLEETLRAEPPIGKLVGNSLRAGRKFRRRRLAGVAAVSAVAAAVVIAVPALLSGAGTPEPAAVSVRPATARTAYVGVGADTVVPVSLATRAVGAPMTVPLGANLWVGKTSAAVTPDGRTVYELGFTAIGGATVTPINTATKRAGKTIRLPNVDPEDIAVDPNGKTAYVSFYGGVFPINIATNTVGKQIRIPDDCFNMAFTPDGKTLYVLNPSAFPAPGPRSNRAPAVTPILTATNTELAPIRLRATKGGPFDIAVTPDGKTAYVLDGGGSQAYANLVIPIDLAAGRALAPIRIKASGVVGGVVVSPHGGTAYVLSSRAITPINTATNKAGPAINLPKSAGYADNFRLAPNGKTIYVITPRGVIPVRTASRTVLPMIGMPDLNPRGFEITPDSRTVYVTTGTGLLPISTASNRAGKPINLGGLAGFPSVIAFAR